MRLHNKTALVFGGGQTPGNAVGNGKATSLLFAREGARVLVVDRALPAAEETVDEIRLAGGEAEAWVADVTDEQSIVDSVGKCRSLWGRIDILHNNVGVSLEGGDAPLTEIEAENFSRIMSINLQGMALTCKHVLPFMRDQGSGAICNIGSIAAMIDYPYVAYRTSKAAVIVLTQHIAIRHAQYGVRANVILPGLINTPMAIENRVKKLGISREELVAERDSHVPLGQKMGTAWDIAKAAVFLVSDDAAFITGAVLTVDGGQSLTAG